MDRPWGMGLELELELELVGLGPMERRPLFNFQEKKIVNNEYKRSRYDKKI
jgi:hypothetical protein